MIKNKIISKLTSITALILFSALILTMFSCGTSKYGNSMNVMITHRTESKLDIKDIRTVLLAGFVKTTENSFDILKPTYDILKQQLASKASFLILFENPLDLTKTKIIDKAKKQEYEAKDIFQSPEIWIEIAAKYKVDMIITGEIGFSNEIGKDLVKLTKFQDNKEVTLSQVVEKKFFKLDFVIYMISGKTGKIIHTEKIYKAVGRETDTEESEPILINLIRGSLENLREMMVVKSNPIQRTLLE
ncbi:MAG: hypothetical protein JW737_01585 [Acidobacteria bacterium]|nr:hypothetical protein [Acidobacteriota bacterium]